MSGYEARVKIYTTEAELPASAFEGQIAYTQDTDIHYYWDGSAWTAMGGGSGTNITLDLGDDGGNDSVALSEIATANDDYGVVTEPSADKMLIDFAKVPPYRKYDPDRPPSSLGTGGIADEFIGGPSLTWRWGNQGTSTIAYSLDQAHLTVPAAAGENLRVLWTTGADGSATDWVATLSMEWDPVANFNSAGIALLVAGDETTPTDIQTCARLHSTNNSRVVFARFNSYTSFNANTDISSGGEGLPDSWIGPTYLQMRYVSSTKELSCHFATRSRFFEEFTTRTLAAHPTTSIGFFINASNASVVRPMYVNFFRQRTDATGTTAPYPCGE